MARRGDRDQAGHHGHVRAVRAVQPARGRGRGGRARAAARDLAERGGAASPWFGTVYGGRVQPTLVVVPRLLRPGPEAPPSGAVRGRAYGGGGGFGLCGGAGCAGLWVWGVWRGSA